jgi:transposase
MLDSDLRVGGKREVKNMEEYIEVRRLAAEGLSQRAIALKTGLHRRTVRKILELKAPPGYRRRQPAARPVLGPYIGVIDAILQRDKGAPKKQRHTAQRIFDRLREEYGYQGGHTQVREYVREAREQSREAFVPLSHDPGGAQADWGEAFVRDGGARRKVYVFMMTLPFSDTRFAACFPRATLEFFLEGHRKAFEFFGGVPRKIVYDNLRSAVTQILRGRGRKLNAEFARFLAYHLIEARFCNAGRGNEKGHVENGVGWARRNLLTPLPQFSDWRSFNAQLAEGCRKIFERRVRGEEQDIGERLKQDRQAMLPVPPFPVDSGSPQLQRASSLCLVRFDTNDYSVPCEFAHHPVVVRADVAEVRIFHQNQCVAAHVRCHEKEQAIYEPWHYLTLVERKPRTLDDGAPLRRLQLDPCFADLRRRMESGQEHSAGTRAFIRVLQLLREHSLRDLTRAVERALELCAVDEEAIKNLLLCPPEQTPSALDLSGRGHLKVAVPRPDLSRYQSLLAGGVR